MADTRVYGRWRNPALRTADDAHVFSCALQSAAKRYSERRNVPSAKRRFRIGIATGEVSLSGAGEHGDQYAGIAIANAVRLQTAAGPSEILVDAATFDEITASSQGQYGAVEEVRGKRAETFRARRCAIRLEYAEAGEETLRGRQEKAEAIPWWKRRFAITISFALMMLAVSISVPFLNRSPTQETASVVPNPGPSVAGGPGNMPSTSLALRDAEKGDGPVGTASLAKRGGARRQGDRASGTPAAAAPPQDQVAAVMKPDPPPRMGVPSSSAPTAAKPQPQGETRPPDPSEFDSASLVGTWEIASGDSGAAEVTLLELHADGTYKKTLSANVKNPDGTSKSYGTTHKGHWWSRGKIVYLSGDGDTPEYLQDLSNARKLN